MRPLDNIWIQRADFSATDYDIRDQSSVLQLFRDHAWQEELNLFRDRKSKGVEYAPPGLGLNAIDDEILHICAEAIDKWSVYFHYSEPYKLLGLLTIKREKSIELEGVSTQRAEQMIAQFFLGEPITSA